MRLIDADAIPVVSADPYEEAGFRSVIEDMPTIDPVKHGKWVIKDDGRRTICSECGDTCGRSDFVLKYLFYCPKCGAKMDMEEKE